MHLLSKQTFYAISLMLAAEAVSMLAYFVPALSPAIFALLVIGFILLCLYRLEYGLLLAMAEIFIGSKGYLFSLDLGGLSLSIRIAFWLIILSVWSGNTLANLIKKRRLNLPAIDFKDYRAYLLLAIFVFWGLVNGILNGNDFSNIFFDFNAWLFFLYLFPLMSFTKDKNFIRSLFSVLTAGVLWLSLKTLILIFIFTHFNPESILGLYRWVRVTGVGEITRMESGFYRIFIQSQIYSLIMLFVWLWAFLSEPLDIRTEAKHWFTYAFLIASALVSLIASYSRSFWVGLAGTAVVFVALALYRKIKLLNMLKTIAVGIAAGLMAILLIFFAVKFPFPSPSADFNASDLVERAGTLSGEAGVSSRWALLPKLRSEIGNAPILGKGFGTTVTYTSSDPRVLQSSADGEYTTYAFEWGWLDIWLKLGLLGLLAYLYLLFFLSTRALSKKNIFTDSLALGLVAIAITSFFSPYTNHPLGITFILLFSLFLNTKEKWLRLKGLA